MNDTIVAIATPPGVGGIGIVRVSGPAAETIARLLFRPRNAPQRLKSHHLYFGELVAPDGAVIDEALVTLMRKPHSYTGEDILELHCHGGPLILRAVLDEVVKAGARPADPGEFTRRAYLNDRLDLAQAEAVMDLVGARTERARVYALSQLRGGISRVLEELRAALADVLAGIEVSIDFTEEEHGAGPAAPCLGVIENAASRIRDIISTYREGSIYRDGISVVIAGKPNVGKSSLLNRLMGGKRAIVTATPGTTRDFIEGAATIRDMPVNFIDTAGVRDADGEIEREGISLVWEKIADADIVIVLLDGSVPPAKEDREVVSRCGGKATILAVNKADLPQVFTDNEIAELVPGEKALRISAKYGDGIEALKDSIHATALGGAARDAECIVANLRHKVALEKALRALERAAEGIQSGLSPELPALDIREALSFLGEIVGETTTEEVLDRIFSRFCIGK